MAKKASIETGKKLFALISWNNPKKIIFHGVDWRFEKIIVIKSELSNKNANIPTKVKIDEKSLWVNQISNQPILLVVTPKVGV